MRGVDIQGSKIVSQRMDRGLTQENLAALSGLDVKTIRRAEQGKRLDMETISRLAGALQTNLASLLVSLETESAPQQAWREIVIQWYRHFDDHNLEPLLALYDEDAVLRLPGGPNVPFGGTFRGKEEIRKAHEAAWNVGKHEPMRLEDFKVLVSDTGVALQGARGITMPSGELVRFPCLQVFTFNERLIADQHVEFDTLEFVTQIQK